MIRDRIRVDCFSDPGCPWGYSANPAFAVLQWRYGDQLDWRLVTIGLTESGRQYEQRGYTAVRMAHGNRRFRRFGMPFAIQPRERVLGTGRACRAIVATRQIAPDREWAAYRALQFAWFNTTLMLDEDDGIAAALSSVDDLDVPAVMAAIDSDAVGHAYEADRAQARRAAGTPTEFQGKSAATDGPVRYTAPSLVFSRDGQRLEAGGFQPVEAYDVLVANLDPTLSRRGPLEDVAEALDRFPDGLTTQEVGELMRAGNDSVDREAAEAALVELTAKGGVARLPLGDDALWRPAGAARTDVGPRPVKRDASATPASEPAVRRHAARRASAA
jgi:2-hydroxychromene-2-carboxylate isomerase